MYMTEATHELPARLRNYGCKLLKQDDGTRTKFVLIHKNRDYRGFIYLRNDYLFGNDSALNDLYANFYYETGVQKVAST